LNQDIMLNDFAYACVSQLFCSHFV